MSCLLHWHLKLAPGASLPAPLAAPGDTGAAGSLHAQAGARGCEELGRRHPSLVGERWQRPVLLRAASSWSSLPWQQSHSSNASVLGTGRAALCCRRASRLSWLGDFGEEPGAPCSLLASVKEHPRGSAEAAPSGRPFT